MIHLPKESVVRTVRTVDVETLNQCVGVSFAEAHVVVAVAKVVDGLTLGGAGPFVCFSAPQPSLRRAWN